MKKIIILSFILFLGIFTYAQDLDYSKPSFAAFPLVDATGADWTGKSEDAGKDWSLLKYARINGDAEQNDTIFSPVYKTVGTNWRLSFDYYTMGIETNLQFEVLIARDNGVDWTAATAFITNTTAAEGWYHEVNVDLNGAAGVVVGDSLRLAFVVKATDLLPTDRVWGIDNVFVEASTDGITYTATNIFKTFDLAFATGGWTQKNSTTSTSHWGLYSYAGVPKDNVDDQKESLVSEAMVIPDNALTDVWLDFNYWYFDGGPISSGDSILIINTVTNDSTGFVDLTSFNNPGPDANIKRHISLNAFKGQTIKIAFKHESTLGDNADFYLDSLYVYQVFDESAISADGNLTLTGDTVAVYPLTAKYGGDFKEGFWQVAPQGWTNTKVSAANWRRESTTGPTGAVDAPNIAHDYYAYIDTVGANKVTMNETLASVVIPITYPATPANYKLAFEWANETNRNAGLNTDPLLGPDADYDYADVIVQIKVNAGAFTTIWQEDNITLLNATSDTDGGNNYYYGWTGYQDYLDNPGQWYKAVLDISQYITATTTSVEVRVNYAGSGVNGGYFALDNLYITEAHLVEFEMTGMQSQSVAATYDIDYYNIPISQVVNPVALSAKIRNNGVATFTTAPLTAKVTVDDGVTSTQTVYGYKNVTSAAWTTRPSTVLFTIDTKAVQYASGLTLTAGNTYTYDYSATLNGTLYSDSKEFVVGTDLYNKHDGNDDGVVDLSDGTSGAIGSLFEFKVNDVVDFVTFYADDYTTNSEVYMSIIKLTTATSTSGTTVYTSPRKLVEDEMVFEADVALTAGFYAFMLHQTDLNAISLYYDDTFEGQVLRGKASALYTASNEKFNLMMDVGIIPNEAPVIVTEFPNDKLVVSASVAATDSVLFEIIATDENGDAITFPTDSITTNPSWLASWMKYKTTKGDTLIIYGKPLSSDLGETEVRVVAKDTKNGSSSYTFTIEVVSDMALSEPDYEADFRLFTQVDDMLKTGNANSWSRNQTYADIYGDVSEKQKERLISEPIKMPAASSSVGISYTLEFDWYLGDDTEDSKYFIGGIPNVLGTEDADGGANYADVSLVVSTDNGGTWSAPIWKEDDPQLLAPVTEGIYQGEKWGYDGATTYTSKINVDAYKGKTVVFAFLYESKNVANTNQNYFQVWDLTVTANNEVDVDVFIHTDLTSVPTQHLDWTAGLDYTVQIINNGQKIPTGAMYSLNFPIQGKYTEYTLKDADFTLSDTIYRTFNFVPDSGTMLPANYTLTATLEVDGNVGSASDSKTITVADNVLHADKNDDVTEYTLAQFDGLGTVYHLLADDYLETIDVNFGSAGADFSISIIQLAKADTTEGKLIATINDDGGGQLVTNGGGYTITIEDDNDFDEPLMLKAGYYAVMFNQLEVNAQIDIWRSDRDQDMLGFVRGNMNMLYNEVDDKGYLDMALNFKTNDAPEFTNLSIDNEEIYQGEVFERPILVNNPNTYGDIFIEGVDIPQWLVFVDNGDGTASLEGSAADAVPGVYTVSLRAHNRFMITDESFEITVLPNPLPEFTTAPPSVAFVNAAFSYKAIATDELKEVVTITAALLPSWLTISAANDTVTLSGTALAANVGNNVVKLTATDVYGNVSHQTFNLFVYANTAPEFISKPVTESSVGLAYSYYVVATDANGNSGLTISANAGLASWLTFTDLGSGKATLVGTPVAAGADTVTLTVTDPAGASAEQKFAIVRNSNTAPVFTSTAVTAATEDVVYKYEVSATDADGDLLYFNTEVIPNWLTFTVTGNGKAVLQGIPLQSSAGDTEVSLLVGDGNNTALQNFTIALTMVNDAPAIISTAVETAIVGEVYTYAVEAYDEEGASLMFNATLPEWLRISEDNGVTSISGIPTELNVGETEVAIAVNDGNSSTEQTFTLSVAGATSVNNDALSAVAMYPNPTSGSFSVRNAEGANVYVINSTGQIIKQINKASKVQVIDISELNAGTYFVKIVSESNVLTKSLNLIK